MIAQQASHPTSPALDLLLLHMEAVNGLNAALRLLESPNIKADSAAYNKALARTMRASTALKRACATLGEGAKPC